MQEPLDREFDVGVLLGILELLTLLCDILLVVLLNGRIQLLLGLLDAAIRIDKVVLVPAHLTERLVSH